MPRRLAIPRTLRVRGKRWRRHSRAAYPWYDSDDIPFPVEDEVPDFPWEP